MEKTGEAAGVVIVIGQLNENFVNGCRLISLSLTAAIHPVTFESDFLTWKVAVGYVLDLRYPISR